MRVSNKPMCRSTACMFAEYAAVAGDDVRRAVHVTSKSAVGAAAAATAAAVLSLLVVKQ